MNVGLGTFYYLFQTLLTVSLTDEQLDRVSTNLKIATHELMPTYNLYIERCNQFLENEAATQLTLIGSVNFQLMGQVMKSRREEIRSQVTAFFKSTQNKQ